MTSLSDLHPGTQLSGRITNMTSFGAFVDCGVGRGGLIHNSNMGQFKIEGRSRGSSRSNCQGRGFGKATHSTNFNPDFVKV